MPNEKSYKMMRAQILTAGHYFQLLGVHRMSSELEISQARRALARYVHPDINGARDAEDLMARTNAAHDTLTHDMRRYVIELNLKPCSACKGQGVRPRQSGWRKVVIVACDVCHGAGVV